MGVQEELVVITNLAGSEDLLLGTQKESQVRDGEIVMITGINAFNIPFDDTRSIGDVLQLLLNNTTAGGTP